MVCLVCGYLTDSWVYRTIIDEDLARTWKLTDDLQKQFNLRESQFCPKCKSSTRNRALASAIIKRYSFENVNNLAEWVEKAKTTKLKIAEINSCGKLHQFLIRYPNLFYSEYKFNRHNIFEELGFIKGTKNEDIMNLSYPDNSIDIVIHSEVLEHVPNPRQALKECYRVLKPGGTCFFTVPIIPERSTRQRVKVKSPENKLIYLEPPSYHGSRMIIFSHTIPFSVSHKEDYLVWWEFGGSFIKNNRLEVLSSDPATQTFVFSITKNES